MVPSEGLPGGEGKDSHVAGLEKQGSNLAVVPFLLFLLLSSQCHIGIGGPGIEVTELVQSAATPNAV